jgi:hypothetical protein
MAAICVTEAILSASSKTPLIVITLDVEKAFDKVDHNILLQKLYSTGIPLNLWATVTSIYEAPREHVVIQDYDSECYMVNQGVRQGGVLSSHLYKLYIHDLLQILSGSEGLTIGTCYIGSPTCADDLLLMATTELKMQEMVDLVEQYAARQRYRINPSKTSLVYYGKKPEADIFLGKDKLTVNDSFEHLGILRSTKGNMELVNQRVGLARRTVYALIPAGLHGQDGLSPAVAKKIIITYVLPRMLFGLEAVVLNATQVQSLETAYRKILRDLQSLCKSVATEAIYLLIGLLPLEAELHQRTLTLWGAIARLPEGSTLRDLATRQMCLPQQARNSWFHYALSIAKRYNIESLLHSAFDWNIPKQEWKSMISSVIQDCWVNSLRQNALLRSSLKHFDVLAYMPCQPNPLWPSDAPAHAILAASYRAKMLTGAYILQENRAKFNQYNIDPTCRLCSEGAEDMVHFIATCPRLHDIRKRLLTETVIPLTNRLCMHIPCNADGLCRFILNGGSSQKINDVVVGEPNSQSSLSSKLHRACSTICYKLHMKRYELLADQS